MRILLLSLALVITAFGQQDVCTQPVATGISVSPTVSPINRRNFGQSFHVLISTIRNAPSQTCTNPVILSVLQASVDGVNFYNIPNVAFFTDTNASGSTSTGVREARWTGYYPFLKVRNLGLETTNS